MSIPPNIKKSSKHVTESSTGSSSPKNSLISMKIGDTLKTSSGRDVLIDCEADGIPKPRVIWTKENEDLSSSGRITIFENGSLLLQKTSEEDSGNFACTVINNRGVDMYSSKIKVMGKNACHVYVSTFNSLLNTINLRITPLEVYLFMMYFGRGRIPGEGLFERGKYKLP